MTFLAFLEDTIRNRWVESIHTFAASFDDKRVLYASSAEILRRALLAVTVAGNAGIFVSRVKNKPRFADTLSICNFSVFKAGTALEQRSACLAA